MPGKAFSRFAALFVGYLILVILFGAWVRISGSGNGCGSHWPTCNGEILPQAPQTKTIIEFTHRLTSGLCGILGLMLIGWAWRIGNRPVFRACLAMMFFLLVESFIGAVLVKKELVAGDASASRAVVVALHLANTLLLTASAATVAWWAWMGREVAATATVHARAAARYWLAGVLFAIVLTNMTGAVTALGDTLFPTRTPLDSGLVAKIQGDLSASQHFLVRLRIVHPIVAALTAMLGLAVFAGLARSADTLLLGRQWLWTAAAAMFGQVVLGLVNIALAAPAWMQILHLLAAQLVWLAAWVVRLLYRGGAAESAEWNQAAVQAARARP